MAHVSEWQWQYVEHMKSLYREGTVDEQFTQLQIMQYENRPHLLTRLFAGFYGECLNHICNLQTILQQQNVDFHQVEAGVNTLYAKISSVGALRAKNLCTVIYTCCMARDRQGCVTSLREVIRELFALSQKLQPIFALESWIRPAGGIVPVVDRGV